MSGSENAMREALNKALATIKSLRATVERREEPVAIVGAGCRFPGGVRDLDGFWRLLRSASPSLAARASFR